MFDEVRYSEGPNRSSYMVDSVEGRWNTDREEGPNLGYKPPHKGGYFPVPPTDTLTDLRTEMALTLEAVGIPVEVFHHEVAIGRAVRAVDEVQQPQEHGRLDHVVQVRRQERRAQARQDGDVHAEADLRDNGSGMHCHQSIWKDEKNLFAGDKYAGLSEMALHYIGGILKHAPAHLRLHQPGHEQLQPAGAGLRGAGQPGVLVAQPLGVGPHPDRRRARRRPSASSSAAPTRRPTRTSRSRR